MAEHFEENESSKETGFAAFGANRWLLVAVIALVVVTGIALGYGYRQQILVGHLTAQQSMSNATIGEMQGQLSAVTAKLNDMTAAQQAAEQAKAHAVATKAASGKKGPSESKRLKELQARIDDQQKELKETQDLVAKNRADLEGSLSSTKDELNGSIAKTHEELIVLQKRGERNYFEFDLSKSKQFQRFGPLTLSLRRTDAKHMNYDLSMVVDDNQLSKKRVNLFEPIWIYQRAKVQAFGIGCERCFCGHRHARGGAPPAAARTESRYSQTTGIKNASHGESGRASSAAPCFFIAIANTLWTKP